MSTSYCALCRSRTTEKFISVPRDENRRKLWSMITNLTFTSRSRVCDKHFKDSDFVDQPLKNGTKRRRLIPNAVPQMPELKKEFTKHVPSTCGDKVADFSSQTEEEIVEAGLILQNKLLQRKNKELEAKNVKLLQRIKTLEDSLNGIFTKVQVKKLQNGGKRVVWSSDDISRAICLQAAGPKAYRHLLKKGFPLPCLSTLSNYLATVDIQPGILDCFIGLMENAVDMKDEDKVCIVTFKEMKVTAHFEFDDSLQAVPESRDYVQVAMAQGLRKSWKQPIYFKFDKAMTIATLYTIIERLHNVGYDVVAIVNDMGIGNHKLWAGLGISPDKTWFEHPADSNKKVFVFADTPHLVKLIRNQFLDTGLIVDGHEITQQTVRQAMKHASITKLNIKWKVKDKHLNPSLQKVKLANDLFSNTTASGIKRCYSLGLDIYKATQTADFIKLVNDWFDVFNVTQSTANAIPTKQPFGYNLDVQQRMLQNMSDIMAQVILPNSVEILQFQKGIIISNNSLNGLFEYVKERYKLKFINTNRISLDQLEHFFEELRAEGGAHDQPTPQQFKFRLRKYLTGNLINL